MISLIKRCKIDPDNFLDGIKNQNIKTQLLDLFGSSPKICTEENGSLVFGKKITPLNGKIGIVLGKLKFIIIKIIIEKRA